MTQIHAVPECVERMPLLKSLSLIESRVDDSSEVIQRLRKSGVEVPTWQ
jgi:hypothetical protein